jgi:CPA2 family monovalent cation:H+ antiporter-2
MTVGAGINFGLLSGNFLVILGLTLGLMVIKTAVLYALAIVFRIGGSDRFLFSLGLAQAGEFGFVLLSFTVANGVIPGELADQLLLVVALSMLLTPALFILYDRVIAPRFSEREERDMDAIEEQGDIIIAGHGRVGGIVARMLRGAGLKPTVIDYSSRQLEMLKKFGIQAYYGDATRPDLLHAAGVEHARLFVIAIDDKDQITELAKYLLEHYPNLHVVARAVDRNHVYDLWYAGCRDIIRETYDSSLRMGRSAVEALGYSREQAERVMMAFQEVDRKGMLVAAQHYDPAVPAVENEAYLASISQMRGDWEAELAERARSIMAEPKAGKG